MRIELRRKGVVLTVLLSLLLPAGVTLAADDRVALAGLQDAKVVFDVSASDPARLWFLAKLIKETHRDMIQQDVEPTMVVSFRGATVKLLTRNALAAEGDEEVGPLQKVAWMLTELAKEGIRLESCGYAARLFAVNQDDYLPEIQSVGNSLVSLLGYQNRGYAVVVLR